MLSLVRMINNMLSMNASVSIFVDESDTIIILFSKTRKVALANASASYVVS
jgi:hypothetical protein